MFVFQKGKRKKQLIIYDIKIPEINITSFLTDLFYFLSFEEGWNADHRNGQKCCVDRNQVTSVGARKGSHQLSPAIGCTSLQSFLTLLFLIPVS